MAKRILIVEDEPNIMDIVTVRLASSSATGGLSLRQKF